MKTVRFSLLAGLTVLALLTGCGSGGGSTEAHCTAEGICPLGDAKMDAPQPLKRSLYEVSGVHLKTFASLTMRRTGVLAYAFPRGTVRIVDGNGKTVFTDLFFPEGNCMTTLPLGAGTYRVQLQRTYPEKASFAVVSGAMEGSAEALPREGTISVAPHAALLYTVRLERNATLDAAVAGEALALYDAATMQPVATAKGRFDALALAPGDYVFGVCNRSASPKVLSVAY